MKTTSPPRARIRATDSRTSAQTRAIRASSGGGRARPGPDADRVLAQPLVRLDFAPQVVLPVRVVLGQLPRPQVRPADLPAVRDVELVDELGERVLVVEEREVARQESPMRWLTRFAGPSSSQYSSTPSNSGLPGPSRKNCAGVTSMSTRPSKVELTARSRRKRWPLMPGSASCTGRRPVISSQTSRLVSNRMREPPTITTPS